MLVPFVFLVHPPFLWEMMISFRFFFFAFTRPTGCSLFCFGPVNLFFLFFGLYNGLSLLDDGPFSSHGCSLLMAFYSFSLSVFFFLT